jgi:hypothetical protein
MLQLSALVASWLITLPSLIPITCPDQGLMLLVRRAYPFSFRCSADFRRYDFDSLGIDGPQSEV